jgi:hypothetical protein
MKWVFSAVFILNFLPIMAQKFKDFKLKINATRDYCQGARPNQKILDELAIAKPVQNQEFVFILNNGEQVSCFTDEAGALRVRLKTGVNYKVFRAEKVKITASSESAQCAAWLAAPDFELNSAKPYSKSLTIHLTCSQCGPRKQ